MENQDTRKFIHYAGSVFLVVAAIAILWQMFGPTWYKNIRAEITSQPYARTVTVDAEGKVTSKPDIAVINFAVVSQGETVQEATKEGNEKMDAIVKTMQAMGIEEKDLMTTQYNLYPRYSNNPPIIYRTTDDAEIAKLQAEDNVQKIVGYTLDQNLQVKIRKLEQVEEVLDAGVESGSNQIGQLSFEIDDPSALKQQAREKAFTTAREKAEQMAKAAGVKLGRVVTFSEGSGYYPQPYVNYAMNMKAESDAATSAPSIQPGSQEIQLNVSVTYEIE